ncbi:hypothetical protein AVEN_236846-1 [Araneus ventricosus]|uniref:Uncharacterized protein n=1 Tax=Araneus ventricosus TaxID=182803 RepID=A0A4Y2N951_ARAVE|nr:hypothetical protein AVEN_236846-1 [Araneus ventricosus]
MLGVRGVWWWRDDGRWQPRHHPSTTPPRRQYSATGSPTYQVTNYYNSATCCAILFCDVYKSVSTSGPWEFLLSITPDPKVPGSKALTSTVVTRKNKQHLLSVPLLDGSTKNHINSIFCYIQQMAALQLLQQRSCPSSKSMTHFTAQSP